MGSVLLHILDFFSLKRSMAKHEAPHFCPGLTVLIGESFDRVWLAEVRQLCQQALMLGIGGDASRYQIPAVLIEADQEGGRTQACRNGCSQQGPSILMDSITEGSVRAVPVFDVFIAHSFGTAQLALGIFDFRCFQQSKSSDAHFLAKLCSLLVRQSRQRRGVDVTMDSKFIELLHAALSLVLRFGCPESRKFVKKACLVIY